MSTTESVKLPGVHFNSLCQFRRAVFNVLQPHLNTVVTRPLTAALAAQIVHQFRYDKDNRYLMAYAENAVHCSLENEVAGRELTQEAIYYLATRLAGNAEGLRVGTTIVPIRGAPTGWALVEVVDAAWHRTPRRHITGAKLRVLVWTGNLAGAHFTQFFTRAATTRLAKELGLRSRRNYTAIHHRQLTRMKFMAEVATTTDWEIAQYGVKTSLNLRNKNRYAARAAKNECQFSTELECHFCPRGWHTCVNGTHEVDYVQKSCRNGHTGWFSPQSQSSLCLECESRHWITTE